MSKITGLPLLLFVMVIYSCRPYDDPGINCTTDYRMLTVMIKDTASKPVILSNYFVKKTSTREIVDFSKVDPIFDSITACRESTWFARME